MAQLVDRSTAVEARWQVRWKAGRTSPGRSQTFMSARASRGKSAAQRDAERLKAYVDLHENVCGAEEALAAVGFVDVITKSGTDGELLESWAERWALSRPGVTARSKHDYLTMLRTHILPRLGHLRVDAISRSDVEAWVTSVEGRVAAKTVRNLHGVLSSVLDAATRETPPLRPDNPAKRVRLRRGLSSAEEMCFLSHGEWALLHRCLERTSRLGRSVDATLGQDLALVLVGSGLRYSEATALKAKHVDLLAPACTIRVAGAWKRQPGGTYLLEEPKTRRSLRTISVSEEVRDALISRCAGKAPGDLVFTTASGGQLKNSRFSNYFWKPAVVRAQALGLEKDPRIHDLRHTHASWLIAAGRPLPSIQRRLGHESISTTVDTYGHLMVEVDHGDLAALSAALSFGTPQRDSEAAMLRLENRTSIALPNP
ncbi:MAG: site-specific integrase [Actinomycetota bacterium]|nr:site-specific integrase [Actinomycetota bacterium]